MRTNKRHANKNGVHGKYVLGIPASDKLVAEVEEVSDFIQQLSLPLEQNDRLVELLLTLMKITQTEASVQGFELGYEHAVVWEAGKNEN